MRGSPERGYFFPGRNGTGGGDSGSGRRRRPPPGLSLVKIHEKMKNLKNRFQKGAHRT